VVELETDKAVIEVPSVREWLIDEVICDAHTTYQGGECCLPLGASAAGSGRLLSRRRRSSKPVVAQNAVPELRAAAVNATIAEFRVPELGENIEVAATWFK